MDHRQFLNSSNSLTLSKRPRTPWLPRSWILRWFSKLTCSIPRFKRLVRWRTYARRERRAPSHHRRAQSENAEIQSLDEPWADTTTPAGKMIMTVFGGIAKFEVTDFDQNSRRARSSLGPRRGIRTPLKTAGRSERGHPRPHQKRPIDLGCRQNVQRPCRYNLSLPQRKSGLMKVYRSAQPYVPYLARALRAGRMFARGGTWSPAIFVLM